jgi:hypothetical protein
MGNPVIKIILNKKLCFSLLYLIFWSYNIIGQPVWNTSSPTVTPKPYRLILNVNLDHPCNIYYTVFPYDLWYVPDGNVAKSWGTHALPYGDIIDNGTINYNSGTVSRTITGITTALVPDHKYGLAVVAEDPAVPGVFSVVKVVNLKTLICPPPYVMTGFPIPSICVNKGTTVYFTIENADANPIVPGKQLDPDFDGIYKGTTWSLNWGDGTINTFTSSADNEVPSDLSFISHVFSPAAATCVFEVALTITNPCGRSSLVKYSLDVHARDNNDLNGQLRIENSATGLTTIQVCEGSEHRITLVDRSTWNCQPPIPIPGTPNIDPRTIQWIYGEDNDGIVMNTIGTTVNPSAPAPVIIDGTHYASNLDGYTGDPIIGITSTGQLSKEIVIPPSCRKDEYFEVYLRNWNKCNPYGIDQPVFTKIRIEVVGAPGLPIAPDKTICSDGDPSLSAGLGTPSGGLLTWYANSDKTGILGTGTDFNPVTLDPSYTAPGTNTYYVSDSQTSGHMCEGPVKPVVLKIRESLPQPGVISGPSSVCISNIGIVFSVLADPPSMPVGGATEYTWTLPSG